MARTHSTRGAASARAALDLAEAEALGFAHGAAGSGSAAWRVGASSKLQGAYTKGYKAGQRALQQHPTWAEFELPGTDRQIRFNPPRRGPSGRFVKSRGNPGEKKRLPAKGVSPAKGVRVYTVTYTAGARQFLGMKGKRRVYGQGVQHTVPGSFAWRFAPSEAAMKSWLKREFPTLRFRFQQGDAVKAARSAANPRKPKVIRAGKGRYVLSPESRARKAITQRQLAALYFEGNPGESDWAQEHAAYEKRAHPRKFVPARSNRGSGAVSFRTKSGKLVRFHAK